MGTAVARVNALVKLCVTPVAQPQGSVPAAGGEKNSSATVAVVQPLRVADNRMFGHSSSLRTFMEAWGPPTRYLTPLSHPKPTSASMWKKTEMYNAVYQLFIFWGRNLWESNHFEKQETYKKVTLHGTVGNTVWRWMEQAGSCSVSLKLLLVLLFLLPPLS